MNLSRGKEIVVVVRSSYPFIGIQGSMGVKETFYVVGSSRPGSAKRPGWDPFEGSLPYRMLRRPSSEQGLFNRADHRG